MHQTQHSQPDGDGPGSHLTKIVKKRSQLYTWLDRANTLIGQLRAELAQSIQERAELHAEVVYWRRKAARRAGIDPNIGPPPKQYVRALREQQLEAYHPVEVLIDDAPLVVGFARHRAALPNPEHELRCWAELVATAREVRAAAAVRA